MYICQNISELFPLLVKVEEMYRQAHEKIRADPKFNKKPPRDVIPKR